MAKRESTNGENRAEKISAENVRFNGGAIITAAQGMDGVSYEKGYPSIAEPDMHINQGRGKSRLGR